MNRDIMILIIESRLVGGGVREVKSLAAKWVRHSNRKVNIKIKLPLKFPDLWLLHFSYLIL